MARRKRKMLRIIIIIIILFIIILITTQVNYPVPASTVLPLPWRTATVSILLRIIAVSTLSSGLLWFWSAPVSTSFSWSGAWTPSADMYQYKHHKPSKSITKNTELALTSRKVLLQNVKFCNMRRYYDPMWIILSMRKLRTNSTHSQSKMFHVTLHTHIYIYKLARRRQHSVSTDQCCG